MSNPCDAIICKWKSQSNSPIGRIGNLAPPRQQPRPRHRAREETGKRQNKCRPRKRVETPAAQTGSRRVRRVAHNHDGHLRCMQLPASLVRVCRSRPAWPVLAVNIGLVAKRISVLLLVEQLTVTPLQIIGWAYYFSRPGKHESRRCRRWESNGG